MNRLVYRRTIRIRGKNSISEDLTCLDMDQALSFAFGDIARMDIEDQAILTPSGRIVHSRDEIIVLSERYAPQPPPVLGAVASETIRTEDRGG